MGLRRFLIPVVVGSLMCASLFAADADRVNVGTPDTLRPAIEDLTKTFGTRYSRGQEFLDRLAKLPPGDTTAFAQLQREALLANPLVSDRPILFVVRPQYWGNHCPNGTLFQNGEDNQGDCESLISWRGGAKLRLMEFSPRPARVPGPSVRTLIDVPEGIVRDPDVRYDGRRIIFSMRRNKADDYHLYEIDPDGRGLRQLTFGSELSDVEPAYLPDGRVVFASTRNPKYCQCNRHIQANLFVMKADGANVHQIGGNTLVEHNPSMLGDGRILFTRWDYVDRHFGPSFGLWTVWPDGTGTALYYGQNAWSPSAMVDARVVPGTQQVVCIFAGCHNLPWGAMAIIDRERGMDGSAPVVRIWPAESRRWLENQDNLAWTPGNIDLFRNVMPKYEDPYPLSERYILVTRTIGPVDNQYGRGVVGRGRTGIFLVDVFGNELLLHEEEPGCFDPMPLASRPRPPVLPARADFSRHEGHFYVHDVYTGTGMDRVPRGTIKYLRIVEAPDKRFWNEKGWGIDASQVPAMNWNVTNNKRVLGDVPVEPDGSAYFTVPANTFLYFQALDEHKMMVQSMRSGTFVQPGEITGCVGCHEHRHASGAAVPVASAGQVAKAPVSGEIGGAPATQGVAYRRAPSRIQPWYGPPREFNYLTEVQPVFDRHCVRCHDFGKPAGETLNLAGDLNPLFNTSYLELNMKSANRWFPDPPGAGKLLIKAVCDGPPAVLPPYSWGSPRSRLVDVIRAGHEDVKLSTEEFERIATWIDLNAPYYGSYASNYRDNMFGRSPLNNKQLQRLRELTGLPIDFRAINLTRPELSPCLARFPDKNGPAYGEALAILVAGHSLLAERPREDMPESRILSREDLSRRARVDAWAAREAAARAAIAGEERRHDKP